MRHAPYTDHVSGRRSLVGLAWASLWLCAPGRLPAQPAVYTVHVTHTGPLFRLSWRVGYASTDQGFQDSAALPASLGGWEVTVARDAAHCGISCAYRRKRDGFGRASVLDLLPPPITAIRVYTDPASKPTTVIVDPAGLRLPTVTNRVLVTGDRLCLPGKGLCATSRNQPAGGHTGACSEAHLATATGRSPANSSAAAPLRI